jgi:ribose-phosphate pyrophosphokinase
MSAGWRTDGSRVAVLSGSAHPALAGAVAEAAGFSRGWCDVEVFPDRELHVVVAGVRDRDVVVVQPTGPPADRNLLELLLIADAAHRSGCRRITAVVPYFGYARQDRSTAHGEALGARVVADVLNSAPIEGVVVVDPHSPAVETMLRATVVRISAVAILADALQKTLSSDLVVVAPDLGAVKLADRYATMLDAPVAYARKRRLSGADVQHVDVVGDVRGRTPLIVDDIISTGATIAAAVVALQNAGAKQPMDVAATHGVFAPAVHRTLRALPLRRIVVSDTLASAHTGVATDVVGVAGVIAHALTSGASGSAAPRDLVGRGEGPWTA